MRLTTLAEVTRILKPGGLLFLEATNLRYRYRYMLCIRLMDITHCFYNPCRLEWGDKLMREAETDADAGSGLASHALVSTA